MANSDAEMKLPLCWACLDDPGPFPLPFVRKPEYDRKRFKIWFGVLFSSTDLSISRHCVETYRTIADDNIELFSFDSSNYKHANHMHKMMRVDVTRWVESFRDGLFLPNFRMTGRDATVELIVRVLIFAQVAGIPYQPVNCNLLAPILHVMYYGIIASTDIEFTMEVVEAVTADAFVRFMSRPPVQHLDTTILDGSQIREWFFESIDDVPVAMDLANERGNDKLAYVLKKWTDTIFCEDMVYDNTLLIWEWIFTQEGISFRDAILLIAAGIASMKRSEMADASGAEIVSAMGDIIDLMAADVIEAAEQVKAAKQAQSVIHVVESGLD